MSFDVPHNGTDTSRAAAASVRPYIKGCSLRILEHIAANNGATADEIEVALNMSHQGVSARCCELHKAGGIVDLGERRPTRSGRNAIVWYVPGAMP